MSIVAAIKSDYRRYEERQAIRESWGAMRYFNGMRIHVVFVVALPDAQTEVRAMKAESIKFEDILQVSMEETYRYLIII